MEYKKCEKMDCRNEKTDCVTKSQLCAGFKLFALFVGFMTISLLGWKVFGAEAWGITFLSLAAFGYWLKLPEKVTFRC